MKGTALWSRDCVEPNGCFTSPVAGLKKLDRNRVVCVRYRDPAYAADFIYPAKRLPGAEVSKIRDMNKSVFLLLNFLWEFRSLALK